MPENEEHSDDQTLSLAQAVEEAGDELLIEDATEDPNAGTNEENSTLLDEEKSQGHPSSSSADMERVATQQEWDSLIPLGNELFQAARHSHYAHNAEAVGMTRNSHHLSVAAGILAAVSAASLLTRVSELPALAHYQAVVEITQGLLALGAACVSAVQSKLNLSKSADMHRRAAAEYGAIRRNMKIMFRLPLRDRDGIRAYFDNLQTELRNLANRSPEISTGIWGQTETRLRNDPSYLIGDMVADDSAAPV